MVGGHEGTAPNKTITQTGVYFLGGGSQRWQGVRFGCPLKPRNKKYLFRNEKQKTYQTYIHYITLHYIALPCIALHYITLYTYMATRPPTHAHPGRRKGFSSWVGQGEGAEQGEGQRLQDQAAGGPRALLPAGPRDGLGWWRVTPSGPRDGLGTFGVGKGGNLPRCHGT